MVLIAAAALFGSSLFRHTIPRLYVVYSPSKGNDTFWVSVIATTVESSAGGKRY